MNFMDLKRLMLITGKTALEILEVVEHARKQIDRQNESRSDKAISEGRDAVRNSGHSESETDLQIDSRRE